MKKLVAVWIFCLLFLCIHAQRIQTIVPRQVIEGNAFQIQYIINDPVDFIDISTPNFDNLKLISGPNYYKGNSLVKGKTQAIENITYTVVPLKVGMLKINPVTARFKNNGEEQSDEINITVQPQPKASFNALSTYTDINLYAPSSKTDLDKLIEENLFIKTEINKRICFLGEAITATFKLYSRLQSTSEVINAPSLYGFSILDILDINESHQSVESINGKIFNTSILRKLQLYPAQTGKLTIDEMELQNRIEFDDSVSPKKLVVEKLMASNPVEITVKPLPEKPSDYTGAVGQFSINAYLRDLKTEQNKQGKLFVTINGKGNFIQFGQPVINWPKEFDVFDPEISDELNKNSVPAEGRRIYQFSFATNQTGHYIIPPVSFSFFDPLSGKFKSIKTDTLKFEIVPAAENDKRLVEDPVIKSINSSWLLVIVSGLLILVTAIILWNRNRMKKDYPTLIEKTDFLQKLRNISSAQLNVKEFCLQIQRLLADVNREIDLSQQQKQILNNIQNDCQLLIYSDIGSEAGKDEIKKKTEELLKQIESDHSAYL